MSKQPCGLKKDRQPLAITQGYIETLIIKKDTISTPEKDRYLSIIMSSLKKLSHLVEQLFEYSKLEANQLQNKADGIEVSVADTGTSIPNDYQPYIFQRYKHFPP